MRLASLTPSNTELAAFLGLGESVVGVDDWSDWPSLLVDRAAKLGPDLQIDLGRVAGLEPDLVLASLSVPGMERVVEGLEERGLPHIVLAPKSLGAVVEDARRLGRAVGVPVRGDALARAMQTGLAAIGDGVRGAVAAEGRPRVYWEWWPKPAIAAGGPGWMSELLAVAGGENVFADRPEESLEVSPDEVVDAAPDQFAACWCGSLQRVQALARVRQREGWDGVSALGRDEHVLLLPESLFGRPGPRLVEGARSLAAALHPSAAGELPPAFAWLPDDLKSDLPLTDPMTEPQRGAAPPGVRHE